jgi:SnoaL-like domain
MKEGKMASLDTLQPAIARIQGAIRQFANGDPEPYKACWSQAADVTIYGGWGAYERGWAQVEPRLEWAAARWRGGHTNFDLLALGTSGALAYTIWIEHGSARLAGIDEYRPILLRVTHLYRQEGDTWKIIHRHADALSEKIPVAAVLLPEGKELS